MPVLFRAACCAAYCLFALPAFADHTLRTPIVEVTRGKVDAAVGAQLYDNPPNPFAGSLTAPSVYQKQQELMRVPGAVDAVPAEEFAKKRAVTLKDALENTPGLFIQQRYGEEVRLSIRGSGLGRAAHLRGVTLLQDGIPINLTDNGGDFQELDPLSARYIEVLRGGNGWQFGSSTLGGAINLVTPTGHTAAQRNVFRYETGSFGTNRTNMQIARVEGKADVFASLTGTVTDGFRAQSQEEKARFNGNFGYRFNDKAETRLYVTYNNLNQEVPGTLTLRQALDDPTQAPALNRINDYQRNIRSVRFANKTSFVFGDKILDVGAFANIKDLFHPISILVDQETQDYGAFARLDGHAQVFDKRNDWRVGVTGRTGKNNAKVFTNSGGSRAVQTGDADQDSSDYNVTAENRLFLRDDVSLVGGLQYSYALRDFTNKRNQRNNAYKPFTALNPKAGVIWDVKPAAQIFANVTRSSEAPTFSELVQTPVPNFVPLDQQTAVTAEIGTRGLSGVFAWDLTAYHAKLEDELLNFTTNSSVPAATFNAGDTTHQGLELGLDWDVGTGFLSRDKLILRQVYNLNDFRFDNDAQYGDNRIAGAPVHQYRAELRYQNAHGWTVTPNLEAVPNGGYADYANTRQTPGYAVVGLNASYDVTPQMQVFVDARNLTDKRYVTNYSTITNAATAATNVFYPGEGRSAFVGVKIAFNEFKF